MPIARVQMPDGRIARFDVPDGTTQQQVESFALNMGNGEEPSMLQQLGRQVGLTARAGIMGATYPARVILNAVGVPTEQAEQNLLTRVGLPTPQGPTERVAQDVAGAMAGAGTGAGIARLASAGAQAAPTVGQLVAQRFAEAPGMQVVSAGTGAGAGGVTRESGGSPTAQTVATVLGSLAPAAAQAAGAAAVRGAFRGGEAGRQTVAKNLETFDQAGTTPTVGQATEARAPRLAETMLTKTPGSAGTMAAKAQAQHAEIGKSVSDLADNLSTRSGAAPAGRAIKGGVESFINDFKQTSGKLYDQLDGYIAKDTPIDVNATKQALETLNADIPGAPNLSKWFKNAKIQGIEGALKADTSGAAAAEKNMPIFQLAMLKQLPIESADRASILKGFDQGQLPYEAVKKLRTLVGNEMASNSLVSDVPRSKWSALYAALSNDLGKAAEEAGPGAQRTFIRANNFYSSGMKRINDSLQPIANKVDPEDVYRAATSGMKEGASTIWATMRSLPKDGQNAVAATVLKRLGVATPGNQNELGEVFSPETFLTNWNKISPEAKTALFSRYGPDFNRNLDSIAKVASNMRTGTKIFVNPSGTEGAFTARMGVAGVLLSTLWGHPGIAASLAGGMATAGAGAKLLMTNPEFVRWLARSTTLSPGVLPGALAALENTAKNQPPDVKQAMSDYVNSARVKIERPPQPEAPRPIIGVRG